MPPIDNVKFVVEQAACGDGMDAARLVANQGRRCCGSGCVLGLRLFSRPCHAPPLFARFVGMLSLPAASRSRWCWRFRF